MTSRHAIRHISTSALGLCVFFGLLCATTALADVIGNPVQHFLATYETIEGDELLKLEADINGDGHNEVLLSLSQSNRYRSGHLWVVYIGVKDGYIEAKGVSPTGTVLDHPIVSFRPDAYYIGQIAEIRRRGIAAYIPGGKTNGTLKVITVAGDKVREKDMGKIVLKGAGKNKYDSYFGGTPSAGIETLPIP